MKPTEEKLKLSFIGCGRVFSHYLSVFEKYKLLDFFEIEAVLDLKIEKADEFGSLLKCPSYSTLSSLLENTDSHLYIVLSPSGTHFEVAQALLENGRNVLVEKPGTLRLDESRILQDLAAKEDLFLGCVHQNRYNSAIQAAKSLLSTNELGRIMNFSVRLRWCRVQDYYEDSWHGTWRMDGGVTSQQAFHHLDALRFLIGEIDSGFSFGAQTRHRLEAEDTSIAVIRMTNGAIGTFEATTTMLDSDQEASIEIFAEKGHICIGGIALNEITSFESRGVDKSESERITKINEKVDNGYGNSHFPLLLAVRRALIEDKKSYGVSWEDSTKTLELIHLLYASQELNIVVNTTDNLHSRRLGGGI
jgi:predicted dehydrogenase